MSFLVHFFEKLKVIVAQQHHATTSKKKKQAKSKASFTNKQNTHNNTPPQKTEWLAETGNGNFSFEGWLHPFLATNPRPQLLTFDF